MTIYLRNAPSNHLKGQRNCPEKYSKRLMRNLSVFLPLRVGSSNFDPEIWTLKTTMRKDGKPLSITTV
ncbi:hypothetical protein Trydic_g14015 [Trypoxylus dichotomus]